MNSFKSFFKSFKYAFEGIVACVENERNLRFHLCAAFYVLIFMQFYDLTVTQKSVVILLIALIISLELVNTSVEKVVDLASPEQNKLAKLAKDASAAAVLVSAIVAVAIAIIYFWDIDTFQKIFKFFIHNIIALVALIVSIVLWILFIFKFNSNKK